MKFTNFEGFRSCSILKLAFLGQPHGWVMEFFASWCGHCHAFAPYYKTVSKLSFYLTKSKKGFVSYLNKINWLRSFHYNTFNKYPYMQLWGNYFSKLPLRVLLLNENLPGRVVYYTSP